jgi:large subunit ribosomal protein L17
MKHRVGFNRLGRKPSHRKSLHRNMVTSLFKHERIRTTKAKAQAIRRTAEKMITRAKVDSVHNRRIVGKDLKDKAILAKLFVDIAPRFRERPGGYTRVLKIGPRPGDAAEMVLLELVGEMVSEPPKAKRGDTAKKAAGAKTGEEKPSKTKSSAKKTPKAAGAGADATPADEAHTDESDTGNESEEAAEKADSSAAHETSDAAPQESEDSASGTEADAASADEAHADESDTGDESEKTDGNEKTDANEK